MKQLSSDAVSRSEAEARLKALESRLRHPQDVTVTPISGLIINLPWLGEDPWSELMLEESSESGWTTRDLHWNLDFISKDVLLPADIVSIEESKNFREEDIAYLKEQLAQSSDQSNPENVGLIRFLPILTLHTS